MSAIVMPAAAPRGQSGGGEGLSSRVNRVALAVAGALTGFGVILWIAANWDAFGVSGRFAIAASVLAASALAAAFSNGLRTAASLTGVLAIGGLLALFGQTYQTGADPWQLFAWWAALALPWLFAARSDAVTALWTIVAFVAMALWAVATAGGVMQVPTAIVFPVWAAAVLITAAQSPWLGGRSVLGETKWSFRLASVLTLAFVALPGLVCMFDTSGFLPIVFAAFVLTAASVALFASVKPIDIALLSLSTLSLDILVIGKIIHAMFFVGHAGNSTVSFLIVGLLASAIIAGSAAWILSIARGGLFASSSPAAQVSGNTWIVTVMTAFGALVAAVPLIAFLALTFGVFLSKGPGPYVLGAVILAGAVNAVRSAPSLGFVQQFGIIALVIGLLLTGFGLFRDLPMSSASTAMIVLCFILAAVLPHGWIAAMFGGIASGFAANLLSGSSGYGLYTFQSGPLGWWLAGILGGAALLVRAALEAREDTEELTPPHLATAGQFLSGWVATCLLGLLVASGPTFLLGFFGLGGTQHGLAGFHVQMPLWSWPQIGSAVLAAGSTLWLMQRKPDVISLAAIAAAILTVILSYVMWTLGAVVFIFAIAATLGRRTLALFAIFTTLWIMGSFYYWLAWPLVCKAYLLAGLGLLLGAAAYMSGSLRFPGLPVSSANAPAGLAAVLISLSTFATAGVVGAGVLDKEKTIKSGRTVFLQLVPVDPRSRIQGDYMALNFAFPNDMLPPAAEGPAGQQMLAIATLDERRLAKVVRYAVSAADVAQNEVVLAMKVRNRRWTIGTDAWYFKEGTSEKYRAARFGEFRVRADGDNILVGLADENLRPLR